MGYTIKFGRYEVEVIPGDYIYNNGASIMFVAKDRRSLHRSPRSIQGLARVGHKVTYIVIPQKMFRKGIFKSIKPEMFKPAKINNVIREGHTAFVITEEWLKENIK